MTTVPVASVSETGYSQVVSIGLAPLDVVVDVVVVDDVLVVVVDVDVVVDVVVDDVLVVVVDVVVVVVVVAVFPAAATGPAVTASGPLAPVAPTEPVIPPLNTEPMTTKARRRALSLTSLRET
ncbi:hypothetical protein [Halocalculus aciditolerans]|uniref:Uncharacterized protein n=1 Tax=Halocalculus aciditolerans TaxID=1383812 RepID=A0A830F9V5_9EURY|nr:hypothetical protein [Halocalculus aciditolerans]GGL68673.1 hypothetical protein GCM10009039_28320 [Halocalculus aciditolerans]